MTSIPGASVRRRQPQVSPPSLDTQIPAAPQVRGRTPGLLSSPSGSDMSSIGHALASINPFAEKHLVNEPGDLPTEVAASADGPADGVGKAEQQLIGRAPMGVAERLRTVEAYEGVANRAAVVRVTNRATAVEHEQHHGRIELLHHRVQTAPSSRLLIVPSPMWRRERRRRDGQTSDPVEHLASPSVALGREVHALPAGGHERPDTPRHRVDVTGAQTHQGEAVPAIRTDALVDEGVLDGHVIRFRLVGRAAAGPSSASASAAEARSSAGCTKWA